MFDGMPDQFYQFLASTRSGTTSASFSLHHHHHPASNFLPPVPPLQATFDHSFSQQLPPPAPLLPPPNTHLLLHHHHQSPTHHHQLPFELQHNNKHHQILLRDNEETPTTTTRTTTISSPSQQHLVDESISIEDPNCWSNDEVLALLRIRSSFDNNWFPDFIWDNVSRKLAELGFKRSAEKCREKFEEETRNFNSNIINNGKNTTTTTVNNYSRLFGELEDFYNNTTTTTKTDHHHHQNPDSTHVNQDHDHHSESLFTQRNQTQQDHHCQNAVAASLSTQEEKTENEDEFEVEEDEGEDEEMVKAVEGEEVSVEDSEKTDEEYTKKVMMMMKKRKRQHKKNKFEMFKGFCESIVNKMMEQQEQLHCKMIEDMVKRDEEKIAKEEAWKKQEIERLTKETEDRAKELAIVGDRQAKILDILKNFMSSDSMEVQSFSEAIENLLSKVPNHNNNSCSNNSSLLNQDSRSTTQPTSSSTTLDQNPTNTSMSIEKNDGVVLPISPNALQNPNDSIAIEDDTLRPGLIPSQKSFGFDHPSTNATDDVPTENVRSPKKQTNYPKPSVGNVKDDTGRRWPRDEVLALINIRCSLFNNNGGEPHHHNDKEGSSTSSKGPLWERISQKMMELGYKRSAKRCKEKWENINKYFRKTKDLNKKRSIDSRTCPYFHQLNHLYSQGTPSVGTTDGSMTNPRPSSENMSPVPREGSNGGTTTMHDGSQGNQGVVQIPSSFDFEF